MPEEYISLIIFIMGGAAGFLLSLFFLFDILYKINAPQYTKATYAPLVKKKKQQEKQLKKQKRKKEKEEKKKESKYAKRLDSQIEQGDSWTEINCFDDGEDVEAVIEAQRKTQDASYEYVRKIAKNQKNDH